MVMPGWAMPGRAGVVGMRLPSHHQGLSDGMAGGLAPGHQRAAQNSVATCVIPEGVKDAGSVVWPARIAPYLDCAAVSLPLLKPAVTAADRVNAGAVVPFQRATTHTKPGPAVNGPPVSAASIGPSAPTQLADWS